MHSFWKEVVDLISVRYTQHVVTLIVNEKRRIGAYCVIQ